MHARLITGQFPAEGLRAGEARVREAVTRRRQLPGNLGNVLLVDRESGKTVAVTFWQDEDAMRASEEAAAAERAGAAQAGSGEVVSVERFEVATLEMAQDVHA